MSTALSAIGGAIDRATLALLWLGRGFFAVGALMASYYAGSTAYTWWTMPQEWPVTFAPVARQNEFVGLFHGPKDIRVAVPVSGSDIPTKRLYEVELPDKRTLTAEANSESAGGYRRTEVVERTDQDESAAH